jgi:hypothetical protein
MNTAKRYGQISAMLCSNEKKRGAKFEKSRFFKRKFVPVAQSVQTLRKGVVIS